MSFAGKGGRKPQLDISIDLIDLDPLNPRLVPYLSDAKNASQPDLLAVMLEHFDLESVAQSLCENGYFDEEPIIIVPQVKDVKSKIKGLSLEKTTALFQNWVDEGDVRFTVVEGNRRTSSIKLITDLALRKKLNIDRFFPKTLDTEKLADISTIPCIIYPEREDVFTYLGVRHIAGSLKWEAFAQASYTADMIDLQVSKGLTPVDAIKEVQKVIPHGTNKIKKQYITFKMYKQAKDDLGVDIRPMINKFSLLTVAYNSAAIREYIGIQSSSKVELGGQLIPEDKEEKYKELLTWIYGDPGNNINPVLTDSRKITGVLSHVVKSEEAVVYLRETRDLSAAYDRTDGERVFLAKQLKKAHSTLKTTLGFAYNHAGDQDLLKSVKELETLVITLHKNLQP